MHFTLLTWILKKYGGRGCGPDSFGSEQGPAAGSCGHSNELLGSIKSREFLD
jgi:hypothetical protein